MTEEVTKIPKNSKQRQLYGQFLRAGNSPIECARLAGYANPEANYQKVYQHPEIQEIVAELKQEKANMKLYSKNEAIKDLKEALRFARLKQDGLAMRHCIAELAKLLKFYESDDKKPVEIKPSKRKIAKDMEIASEEDLIHQLGGETGVTSESEEDDV